MNFNTLRHAVGSWLFGLRLIATAAWRGQKAWAVALWKANPVRTGIAVGVLVLLSFCSGKAVGAAAVTEGPWTLYRGTAIVQPRVDYPTLDACVAAAAQMAPRAYSCRTIASVLVTADAPPPVDCEVSAWGSWQAGAWSACSNGTQSRTETRSRTVTRQPANGGQACPVLTETRTVSQPCSAEPPLPPAEGEWLDSFTFPVEEPETFTSPDWEVQRYSLARETWDTPEAMQADHGEHDCAGPPAQHPLTSYDGMVFRCRDHVMTAVKAEGYGVIVLTPNRMLDWSEGPATLSFNLSTKRNTRRDWLSFTLSPFEDALTIPAPNDAPSLNGQPRNAVWVKHMASGNLCAHIIREFTEQQLPCRENPDIEDRFTAAGSSTSASRRDPVVITVSRTHITVSWAGMVMVDADFPQPLTFTRAVVQLGHYSYNPTKDCDYAPQLGCAANTWHWDEVKLSRAVPFTIIKSKPRALNYSDGMVTLDAPAPANAHLRFGAYGFEADVSFDGGVTWVKPTAFSYARTNDPDGQFHAPIPEGTTSVRFRRVRTRPIAWWPQDFGWGSQIRDVTVWAK